MERLVEVVAFTAKGAELACRLVCGKEGYRGYAPKRYLRPPLLGLEQKVGDWAAQRFCMSKALVFIGATGIAVRAVAPLLQHKGQDPAVICIDQEGRYVIPLVSGHIGGANRLACQLADLLGAEAVVTTATDVAKVFSPDDWAAKNGCAIPDIGSVKKVSAALLDGEPVGLHSDFPVQGQLPKGLTTRWGSRCGIEISLTSGTPYPHTLWLVPKCLCLGIGCRRGIAEKTIEAAAKAALNQAGLPWEGVGTVATIDIKQDEEGLLAFCYRHRLPLKTYTAAELAQVPGEFTSSSFVRSVTGVDNVCERAALAGGGELLAPKTKWDGVTIALAKQNWRAVF